MTTCQQKVQNPRRPRVRPAADLVEREDGFYLYLDMPGVERQELIVDIDGSELTVHAHSRFGCAAGERIHAFEFGDVEYYAQFTLSDMVDRAATAARLADGVLTIYMPKQQKVTPRRIRIEVL